MIGQTQWLLSNAPWFAGLLALGVVMGWAISAWRQRRRGKRKLRFVQAVRSEARRIAKHRPADELALTTVFRRPAPVTRPKNEPRPAVACARSEAKDVPNSLPRMQFAAHEGVKTSLYNLRELLSGEGE